MEAKRQRETFSDEKNLTLFISYLNVIKRHGEYASKITVLEKVEEAARPLYIGTDRARRIIGKMLKDRNKTNKITIMECNEVLEELRKLAEIQFPNVENEKLERKVEGVDKILRRVGVDRTHEEVKELVQKYLIYG